MTTHELGFTFVVTTLQHTWKQTWTKFNIEQKKKPWKEKHLEWGRSFEKNDDNNGENE